MSGSGGDVRIAFVGAALPDNERFHNFAFSRAGAMFISNLLGSMAEAGARPDTIISFVSIQAYPRGERLFSFEPNACLENGQEVTFVPFVNLPVVKYLTISALTAIYLMGWAWRCRKSRRIIYTFNLSLPSGVFTLAAARLTRSKAVVSLNDINEPGETVPNSLGRRIDYAIQRWVIPKYDGHIVVSDAMMSDFAPGRNYVRVEGGITPYVVTATEARKSPRQSPSEPFVMVAAGSLDAANGIPLMLAAMKHIPGSHISLRIAGNGPLLNQVRAAATDDPRIQYAGYLSFSEVLALYTQADLLLNIRITKSISTRYFFPSKLMEYLASGTPVVTTRTGRVSTEFSDAAVFLDDETPEALAKLLTLTAARDPRILLEIGERARDKMLRSKTWALQGRKVADYLRGVATGSTP
jgi:glycosyltransferase involved in cell wall biosynthesis